MKNKHKSILFLAVTFTLVCVYATLSFADETSEDILNNGFDVAYLPSFDCSKVTTTIEKTICNNPELSNLDQQMAKNFYLLKLSLSSSVDKQKQILHEQQVWLKQRITNCLRQNKDFDEACLIEMYKTRNEQIMQAKEKVGNSSVK